MVKRLIRVMPISIGVKYARMVRVGTLFMAVQPRRPARPASGSLSAALLQLRHVRFRGFLRVVHRLVDALLPGPGGLETLRHWIPERGHERGVRERDAVGGLGAKRGDLRNPLHLRIGE